MACLRGLSSLPTGAVFETQAEQTLAKQQDRQAPLSALPDKATMISSQLSHHIVLASEGNREALSLASTLLQRQEEPISASLAIYSSGKASSWNWISVLH